MTTIPTNPVLAPVQMFLPNLSSGDMEADPVAAAQFASHFVPSAAGAGAFERVHSIPRFAPQGGGLGIGRFPAIYPFTSIPDSQTPAVVCRRDVLRMGDIPQMAAEFARIKRNDLTLLHLIDEIKKCYDGEGSIKLSDVTPQFEVNLLRHR